MQKNKTCGNNVHCTKQLFVTTTSIRCIVTSRSLQIVLKTSFLLTPLQKQAQILTRLQVCNCKLAKTHATATKFHLRCRHNAHCPSQHIMLKTRPAYHVQANCLGTDSEFQHRSNGIIECATFCMCEWANYVQYRSKSSNTCARGFDRLIK